MSDPPRVTRARAPAKINLTLEVLGARPDGFHEVATVIHRVSLADTLAFTPRGDGRITLSVRGAENDLGPAEHNLVWRAADALRRAAGRPDLGVDAVLEKRVPVGRGLGGGSADAAATLRALNGDTWHTRLSDADLARLAAGLGSDVPALLLAAPTVFCRGRGERVAPLPDQTRRWFVIVSPAFALATPRVYAEHRAAFHPPPAAPFSGEPSPADGLARLRDGFGRNDLLPATARLDRRVDDLLRAAGRAGVGDLHLSGSGSAFWTARPSAPVRDETLARLARALPDVKCFAAETDAG